MWPGERATKKLNKEGDAGKVLPVAVAHTSSSEDTQQTSLAEGEGGKPVIRTDRAPDRNLACQARSIWAPAWARRPLEAPELEKGWKKGKIQEA